mmetsp:Transcript_117456/g.339586  ORF Transcript_117456/g.339586 Transcript_117456/m.339586 type:complete len:286 (+) Transcript_117456:318-1175(+)
MVHDFFNQFFRLIQRIDMNTVHTQHESTGLTTADQTGRQHQGRNTRPEFGNIVCHFASITHNDNKFGTDINGGFDGRTSHGFSGTQGTIGGNDRIADRLKQDIVIAGNFGIGNGAGHDFNGSLKIRRIGGFTAQHDGIGSVVDRIGHVRTFGTGRAGVLDHGFQHLRGRNDGFAGNVAFSDHPFLGQEDLGGRNFHSQISTGDHNTVGFFENFIKILQTFLIFNFANHFNMRSVIVGQEFLEIPNVLSGTNKGGRNEFDAPFNTKIDNILDILFGKRREFDFDAR